MAKVKKDRSEFYPHETKFTPAEIAAGSTTVSATEVVSMLEARAKIMVPDTTPFKFLDWTTKDVRFGDLDFNFSNERGLLPTHINDNIYSNWRKNRATPLLGVRHPKTKRIEIVDGMQHGCGFALSFPSGLRDDILIPVTITVSADPNLARELFYAANAARKDVSPYKLFTSKLGMKDPDTVKLNNAVEKARFFVAHTGIKERRAFTHIKNLVKTLPYGGTELTYVLEKMAARWPKELNVSSPLVLGLLELRKELKEANLLTDALFNNIMQALQTHFNKGSEVWQDCNNAFALARPKESMRNERKAMNGIIYIHNITFPKKEIKLELQQEYDIPLMPPKFGLHRRFNKKTYQTFPTFAKVCKTGDLRYSWAHAQASKYKVTPEQLYKLCVKADKCPAHGCKSTKFDWSRGDNIKKGGKSAVNTPSVDHIFPKAQGGKDELTNYQITCKECNTILNSQVPEDHTRIASHHIPKNMPENEKAILIAKLQENEALLIKANKKYADCLSS